MTFSSKTRTYEFTAFTEADLLQGVNGSIINIGDKFVMPSGATVCFTVRDDDGCLSGDVRRDDNADDSSWQTAQIDGAPGNGGQIYAEQYHILRGSDGRTYTLVEIEQEGSHETFFTFYGAQPAAGVTLTVTGTCNVTSSWISYDCLGAGEKVATGTVSGTVFCDTNCDGINGTVATVPGKTYSFEAESLCDSGFKTVSGDQASGGRLVRLDCGDGALWTDFKGESGTYDVKISVQDENDGRSTLKLFVDGKYVTAVRLDRDSDGSGSDNGGFSTFVIKGVKIDNCDEIKIVADGDKGEFVRIDKIELVGAGKEIRVEEPVKEGVTIRLLDKDGNQVAVTQTDKNGNYSFKDVPVGQYKVVGVAPDGTEFTIKDAGGNDAIDSDVGKDGASDLFTVVKDKVTDIDLGVCDKPELPGSLSGRFFCDDNRDGLDNDGAANGIAGVLVELLDASGNPTGITTTTDANGTYSFTNLVAGTYGVKFTDIVSGKTLTARNVDGNASDDIDSDAEDLGGGMSQITGIVVVAGLDTPDNDAGVFQPNAAPEAVEDRGRTCVNEAVVIDVLANDSDADEQALTVTAVNGQAIAEGGSVVIDGVTISLVNGELRFDGSAAADLVALKVGEKAERVYSYTITDGEASATADVTVGFCGSAETLAELKASLPAALSFQIIDENDPSPSSADAFTMKLSGTGDARFDGLVVEEAYCVSALLDYRAGQFGTDIDAAPLLTGTLGIADRTSIPAGDLTTRGVNGQTAANNLDLMTWIVNQDFGAQGYTDGEIQSAIWALTDGALLDDFYPNGIFIAPGAGDAADAKAILDLALANGEGYAAGPGGKVLLYVDPDAATSAGGHKQPFVIAVDFDSIDCLC